MKTSLLFVLFFAVAFAAPIAQNEEDDDCSIVWIAVDGNGPEPSATALSSPTAEAPVVTPTVISSSASETISISASQNKIVDTSSSFQAPSPASDIRAVPTASSTSAASASSGSKQSLPVSMPTLPVHGDHLSASQAKDTVPTGAAIYTVPDGKNFNGTEFGAWMFKQNDAKLASKFIKIAPGTYNFDTNDNIQIFWISDDWTFDFRDVTLLVSITDAHPETNQAIYIGQCKGLTILGGTIWFDQGEQWTQAKVISTSPIGNNDGQLATFEVQEGYNVSAWTTAGPRNQGCVDISNPNHYTRPDCNFWYSNTYDFSQLASTRRFTSHISGSRSGIKDNYILTMQSGPNSQATLASENSNGLHVRGMTSNGAFAQYGLGSRKTAIFEDVWYVNPPPRPGFAPRVNGPTLSWGHIGQFNFDAGGEAPATYTNSFWQYTGSKSDVRDMNQADLPKD